MSGTKSKSYSAAVLTVSGTRYSGENVDTVGPKIANFLTDHGFDPVLVSIVPDEIDRISEIIIHWTDGENIDLVISTGGTGLAPRDVTPEATRKIIDREIPGIADFIRNDGGVQTSMAWLSRAVAGMRGNSLIINVPGSERGAMHALETVIDIIPHAIQTIQGDTRECGKKVGEHDHHPHT